MPKPNNKRKYFQNKPAQDKRPRREELSPGMTGFLVSSSHGNDRRSVLEAYDLLNEQMDVEISKLDAQPTATETPTDDKPDEKNGDADRKPEEELDMEKAMADELKSYRSNAGIEERKARFKSVDSGCSNQVFISSAVTDPTEFAFNILTDIHHGKKGRARYMQRLLPVVATCRADLDSVKIAGEKALSKYFSNKTNPSYLILFKSRNSALTLTRDSIISIIGDVVRGINPECRANLDDPDYAISVDVIKTICCISVVRDFTKLKKYNIHVEEEQDGNHCRVIRPSEPTATISTSPEVSRGTSTTKDPDQKGDAIANPNDSIPLEGAH